MANGHPMVKMLDLHPSTISWLLYDLEQGRGTQPLWTSGPSSTQWG